MLLCQFVGDLLVEDVFDGKGANDFAGLFEKRLYFAASHPMSNQRRQKSPVCGLLAS